MNKLPRGFSLRDNTLWFRGIDILRLVNAHQSPLRINFPELLIENYTFLTKTVQEVLKSQELSENKFLCGYAIKANQNYDLVVNAAKHTSFLEVSSKNYLDIIEQVKTELGTKMIICHGFKPASTSYFKKIVAMHKKGFTIIPVINSVTELYDFGSLDLKMSIGVRISAKVSFGGSKLPDRFGLTLHEIQQHFAYLTQHKTLSLTMLHMHVANTISDIPQRIQDFDDLFTVYEMMIKAEMKINYICTGGGLPERSYTPDYFYTEYYQKLIFRINQLTTAEYFPILLSESGRFLATETQFVVLKVIAEKNSNDDFSWYVLNGSAINLIPETVLDGNKHFPILPVNFIDRPSKTVICSGATCDQADFFHTQKINLPQIDKNDSLFVTIPGTGAYQESLLGSSRNTPGHCLIEATNELTITASGICSRTTKNDFLQTLGYTKQKSFFKWLFSR